MRQEYIKAGKILGTHGVKGELKLEVWCDSVEFLKRFKAFFMNPGTEPVKIISIREQVRTSGPIALVRLEGVKSIEQADCIRGRTLYVKRDEAKLKEGQYFLDELVGAGVYDGETGRYYGIVQEVYLTGANDVYAIRNEAGREYLFPAVAHMIKSIDIDSQRIEVYPIPGIFDDGGEKIAD